MIKNIIICTICFLSIEYAFFFKREGRKKGRLFLTGSRRMKSLKNGRLKFELLHIRFTVNLLHETFRSGDCDCQAPFFLINIKKFEVRIVKKRNYQ